MAQLIIDPFSGSSFDVSCLTLRMMDLLKSQTFELFHLFSAPIYQDRPKVALSQNYGFLWQLSLSRYESTFFIFVRKRLRKGMIVDHPE